MDIPPSSEFLEKERKAWDQARRKIKLHNASPLRITHKTGSSIGDRREITSEIKVKPPVDNTL